MANVLNGLELSLITFYQLFYIQLYISTIFPYYIVLKYIQMRNKFKIIVSGKKRGKQKKEQKKMVTVGIDKKYIAILLLLFVAFEITANNVKCCVKNKF